LNKAFESTPSSDNGIEMMENGDCQKCDSTDGKFIVNILNIISYGPRIIVASIKPINKGEEVSAVAYTDLLQPKAMRQSELWLNCANLSSETDYVDDAITEYLTVVNPNSYCEKLENLLIHGLLDGQFEPKEEKSKQQFWMHPLHHLSSSAYTTLASLDAFNMSRTSTAYSLLLAGATNHLFLSGSSLIASIANFCTSTGETLLNVARSCVWKLLAKQGLTIAELSHFPGYKCCNYALGCYLKLIKDPIDFRWVVTMRSFRMLGCEFGEADAESSVSRGEACECLNPENVYFFQLGVHCVQYRVFIFIFIEHLLWKTISFGS
ncbi:Protein SET DOMAIN GROUP 41, partial [Camellia lanceoleosa]